MLPLLPHTERSWQMWGETQHDTLYPLWLPVGWWDPMAVSSETWQATGQGSWIHRNPLLSSGLSALHCSSTSRHCGQTGPVVISLEKMSWRALLRLRSPAVELARVLGEAGLGSQGPSDYTVQWFWCYEKQCSSCFIGHSWMLEL